MQRNKILLAAALGLSFNTLTAQANLLTNGDFTSGLNGWVFSGTPGGDALVVHNGETFIKEGSTGSDGYISQTINTTIGQQYDFSFDLINEGGGPTNNFTASFGNSTLVALINANGFGKTTYDGIFTATAATTVIQFAERQDPAYWEIGNASVTSVSAVPVPAAVWLFGSALAGFGLFSQRRKTA